MAMSDRPAWSMVLGVVALCAQVEACGAGRLEGPARDSGGSGDLTAPLDGSAADRSKLPDTGKASDSIQPPDKGKPVDKASLSDNVLPPDKAPPDSGPLPDKGKPPCTHYSSGVADTAPVQTVGPVIAGKLLPAGYAKLKWARPTTKPDYTVAFKGTPGSKAKHEGLDLIIGKSGPADVPVRAIAAGVVVYVRLGCPQSCMFCHNASVRECGAGWGDHVVLSHGGGLHSRYAHLKPGSVPATVRVGQVVALGQKLALMGNTGRSETRHLHLELATHAAAFNPCGKSQSFDLVFDAAQLPW